MSRESIKNKFKQVRNVVASVAGVAVVSSAFITKDDVVKVVNESKSENNTATPRVESFDLIVPYSYANVFGEIDMEKLKETLLSSEKYDKNIVGEFVDNVQHLDTMSAIATDDGYCFNICRNEDGKMKVDPLFYTEIDETKRGKEYFKIKYKGFDLNSPEQVPQIKGISYSKVSKNAEKTSFSIYSAITSKKQNV